MNRKEEPVVSQLPVHKHSGNMRTGSDNNKQRQFAIEEEEDSVVQENADKRKRDEKAD